MSVDPRHILLSFADRIAHAVVEELKDEAVGSIFAAGSAARGEVAAFVAGAGIEIYSDVDVFVVVASPRDLEAIRRRARRAASGVPRDGGGWSIIPEPGIGVFSEEDFLRQKTRPGTVEIADAHVVLHGNGETPKRARKFAASDIPVSEALYLIENRLTELAGISDGLEEDPSDGTRRYLVYAVLKSCLDAASAVLIAAGRFHAARGERMRIFRDAALESERSRLLPEGSVACIERCHAALSDLQKTLEHMSGDEPDLGDSVESMLLGAWKRIAARAGAPATEDWEELIGWRCKRGRWVGNSRELGVLAGRRGVSRLGVLLRRPALCRFSPVDALRLSGAVETLLRHAKSGADRGAYDAGAVERRYVSFLDGLTRAFGHTAGPVFRRGRRLFMEMS
jgi:hypothetical protein